MLYVCVHLVVEKCVCRQKFMGLKHGEMVIKSREFISQMPFGEFASVFEWMVVACSSIGVCECVCLCL